MVLYILGSLSLCYLPSPGQERHLSTESTPELRWIIRVNVHAGEICRADVFRDRMPGVQMGPESAKVFIPTPVLGMTAAPAAYVAAPTFSWMMLVLLVFWPFSTGGEILAAEKGA